MYAWEQIQTTVDYIEDHLGDELRVEELAGLAALSPFYYQRLFGRLVKKPVGEYIRLRRMAKAADVLLQTDGRIIDVALELGFSTHEHFTRTFKETFGMTPEEYRRKPVVLLRMTKPELLLHYTYVDEGVLLVTDGIVLEINRKVLSAPVYFIGLEAKTPVGFVAGLGVESGPDPLSVLWDNFHEQKAHIAGLREDSEEIGVSLPGGEEGYFTYFGGAKTDFPEHSEGFHGFMLPAGEYIVCSFEAEDFQSLVMDALYKATQYLFGTWLPGRGMSTEPFLAERYATHGEGTTSMEVWVKVIGI